MTLNTITPNKNSHHSPLSQVTIPTQDTVLDILWEGICCEIDDLKTEVRLVNQDWKLIGKMYAGSFWIGNWKFDHNWIEIEEEYKWQWYATILFHIYTDRKNFWKLKEEYCRRKDMYYFYTKMGYKLSDIIDKNGKVVSFYDIEEVDIDSYLEKGFAVKLTLEK